MALIIFEAANHDQSPIQIVAFDGTVCFAADQDYQLFDLQRVLSMVGTERILTKGQKRN